MGKYGVLRQKNNSYLNRWFIEIIIR